MAETRAYQLHRLNGENYLLWKRQMEIFMTENKLKPYIMGIIVKTEANCAKWEEKDAEAQAFLMRGLELEQLKYLSDCATAAQMWCKLQTVYSQRSDQSVQVLLERFINCKIEENEPMADFIARVVSQRLREMNLEQKEPVVIAKIIGSLPSKYNHVRTAWYAVPRNEQTIDKLTDHLINEESILSVGTTLEDASSEAYTARGSKFRLKKTNFNKKAKDNVDTSKKQNLNNNFGDSSRKPGRCNYCNIPGH